MTYNEVLERIKDGDLIIQVFYSYRVTQYVERDGKRIFDINHHQFKKLTAGIECQIYSGGFTKHIYKYNK